MRGMVYPSLFLNVQRGSALDLRHGKLDLHSFAALHEDFFCAVFLDHLMEGFFCGERLYLHGHGYLFDDLHSIPSHNIKTFSFRLYVLPGSVLLQRDFRSKRCGNKQADFLSVLVDEEKGVQVQLLCRRNRLHVFQCGTVQRNMVSGKAVQVLPRLCDDDKKSIVVPMSRTKKRVRRV